MYIHVCACGLFDMVIFCNCVTLYHTTGELFAQCPVDAYPGIAVESVMDSSRYFVLRIKDPSGMSVVFFFTDGHQILKCCFTFCNSCNRMLLL